MDTVKKTKRKPTGAAAMGAGPGRPAGVPNKVTTEFRETVRRLLEDNAENVALWLSQVAAEDPDKALDKLVKLAEFAAPKLSRQEVTGTDGGSVKLEMVRRVIVDPRNISTGNDAY